MSLLTLLQSACLQLGLDKPVTVASSTDRTFVQLIDLANEAVNDLRERHNWSALQSIFTATGNGVQVDWPMPADFDRFSQHPSISRPLSPDYFWPAGPLNSPEWQKATTYLTTAIVPVFRLQGNTLSFYPVPATGEQYFVAYQSNQAINRSTTPKQLFEADNDVCAIDEILVKMGVIWMWRRAKGFDYAQEMDNYERSLERIASYDGGLMPVRTVNTYLDRSGLGDVRVNA